jgi:hypothetical protein
MTSATFCSAEVYLEKPLRIDALLTTATTLIERGRSVG